MAIEFDIKVGNNTVRITVGGGGQAATTNSTDQGGSSPGASSGNSGGSGPSSGVGSSVSSLAVIGPIVIDGSYVQSGIQGGTIRGEVHRVRLPVIVGAGARTTRWGEVHPVLLPAIVEAVDP